MSALARTFEDYSDVLDSEYREIPTFTSHPFKSESLISHPLREEPVHLTTYLDLPIDRRGAYKIAQIQPIPQPSQSLARSFHLLQQWEGVVSSVEETSFIAVISDKTNSENFDEQVELDLEEVSADDLCLVRPGALFYWSVGYEEGPGIPRQRVSRLRFRRLPGLTMREIEKAKLEAQNLKELFM